MLKTVIFDMDGVIIDSQPIHYKIELEMMKEFGFVLGIESLQDFAGTTSQHVWSTLKIRYNLEKSVEELIEDKKARYMRALKSEVPLMKGAKELISNLRKKGYRLAIASSSPLEVIEVVVDSHHLKDYFNEVVSGECLAKCKPEPDIFLLAAKRLGVEPHDCVVIEDAHNGVIAAKRAGMNCIGLRNPNTGNQDLSLADKIVDRLGDINMEKM